MYLKKKNHRGLVLMDREEGIILEVYKNMYTDGGNRTTTQLLLKKSF